MNGKGRFDPEFRVERLRPAPYNPRVISEELREKLADSVAKLGVAKPLIVTEDGTIVAGHQRSSVCKEIGLKTVPAFVLDEITEEAEVRFNQLHNGTDLDEIDQPVRVVGVLPFWDFKMADANQVEGDLRSSGASVRDEICRLLAHYGNWGGAVVAEDGEVISGQQYVLACKVLRWPVRVYAVPMQAEELAREAFARSYGEFSYSRLKREPWVQTLAQLHRCRGSKGKRNLGSTLYEELVLPGLRPDERLLDFGCGQADYLKLLLGRGYSAWGYEPYFRVGGKLAPQRSRIMAEEMAEALETWGLFDVVVCDSVLNSVDRPEAERDVLQSLAMLCRPGGRVYFGCRKREFLDSDLRRNRRAEKEHRRSLEFLDKDGFSGILRGGHWFYQRYHTREEVEALARKWFGDPHPDVRGVGHMWQVWAENKAPLIEDEVALAREFDLPYPDGTTLGWGDKIMGAWWAAARIEAKKASA